MWKVQRGLWHIMLSDFVFFGLMEKVILKYEQQSSMKSIYILGNVTHYKLTII